MKYLLYFYIELYKEYNCSLVTFLFGLIERKSGLVFNLFIQEVQRILSSQQMSLTMLLPLVNMLLYSAPPTVFQNRRVIFTEKET